VVEPPVVVLPPPVTRLVVIATSHVTRLPPPLSDPLHWSTVTGSADEVLASAATEHVTLRAAPPPLAEPLHWVTMAPVVLAGKGEQLSVGWVPPPVPDPTHWFTVAAVGAAGEPPMMVLVIRTWQVIVLPPPLPEPLHWWTAVTSPVDLVVVPVVATQFTFVPAQYLATVMVDEAAAPSSVLAIVTSQRTTLPAPSAPLHWSTPDVALASTSVGASAPAARMTGTAAAISHLPDEEKRGTRRESAVTVRPSPEHAAVRPGAAQAAELESAYRVHRLHLKA
jgi:hypothetical protein